MSRAGDIAEALLRVLVEHVEASAEWEAHWTAVAQGELKGAAEVSDHKRITANWTVPLLEFCKEEGFRYESLRRIVPAAFETTYEEREDILEDLVDHVHATYDLDIPF